MLRDEIVGVDELVPVLDGRLVQYVNLDNAATTPPLRAVVDAVQDFLPMAASVHRGSGYKSRLSTAAFEDARRVVGDLVGADPDRDVVIFTKNTTEAINRFARTMTVARRLRGVDDDARAPLQSVAVASSRAGRAHTRRSRRFRRRGRPRHETGSLRGPHRRARRDRRVERDGHRAADPSDGSQGSRGRWTDPRRRRPAGRSSPHRHASP